MTLFITTDQKPSTAPGKFDNKSEYISSETEIDDKFWVQIIVTDNKQTMPFLNSEELYLKWELIIYCSLAHGTLIKSS